MKVVASPGGAASVNCLIDVLLSGLRLDSPGAKVRRRPDVVGVAAVVALSEIGGGGGGCAPGGGGGVIGARAAVAGTLSGMAGCGAAGADAAALAAGEAAVADGEAVAADGEAAAADGEAAVAEGEVKGDSCAAAVGRLGEIGLGAARDRWLAAGWSGSACSACRSTVTCASTGVAAVINTVARIGNRRIATIGSGSCCSVQ